MSDKKIWNCPKCHESRSEKGQLAATGGGLFSKMFNVQSQKFTTISCKTCRYTEIYRADTGMIENIFDFLAD